VGISLKLDGVEVSYGATTALHGVSLAVEPGEFFCLLGPSGCGKTTILNVVAGFLPLRAGRVLLGGEDVTRLPPQRRKVGVVFQSYALYPHMTVEQNVAYGLKVQKRPVETIAPRVAEMLALVRLSGKETRYPRQLSGGEQQRVAIARALAIEPRLLLLDEPLSNLDARLRDEMRAELKRIQRAAGVTTVFVTHDQAEALGMGDRVAVINAGRIEQVGTPRAIYRTPTTPFVANFVGRSNIIRGIAEVTAAGTALDVGDRRFTLAGSAWSGSGPVSLFLRPEELWVDRAPRAGNAVPGTVLDAVYGGSTVSYRVETPIGELEICQVGRHGEGPGVGETVHVGWPAEAGYPLPEGGR
jgi:putative spermidine/putrescine transport system ATP-binding protein